MEMYLRSVVKRYLFLLVACSLSLGNFFFAVSTALAADTTRPVINTFTVPAVSSTLTVAGIVLTANDNVGVTGYYLSTSSYTPWVYSSGWRNPAPTSYTFTSTGTKTLYAWAKDAAGNISSPPRSAVVLVTQSTQITINTAETGTGTILSPWNTKAFWVPETIPSTFPAEAPMIKYAAFFNATGGMIDSPEYEIYDEDTAGNPVYHFDRLTAKIDSVVAAGLTPYIALSFTPVKLASRPEAISAEFGTNTSPPKDWGKYYDFIEALFNELKFKYGADNVSSWRFRCGTEPDNTGWWSGTRDEWFMFYDYTVSAARVATPGVRISVNPGNFMSPSSSLISSMADRVEAGTFSIAGEKPDMPSAISFSSYHYIYNPPNITGAVTTIRNLLAPYPLFAGIPLAIDEGYIPEDENGRIMFSRLDGTELGGSHFSLLTAMMVKQNIMWGALWNVGRVDVPAPARNVLNLFQELLVGGQSLNASISGGSPAANDIIGGVAVRTVGNSAGQVNLMLYSHNPSRTANSSEPVLLKLRGMPATGGNVTYYRIDRDHANYSAQWLVDSAGIPRNAYTSFELSPYDLDPLDGIIQQGRDLWNTNISTYTELAKVVPEVELATRVPTADGTIEIPLILPAHGVLFVTVTPPGANTISGTISPASSGAGATVTLTRGTTIVATVTASADGLYSISSVADGIYTVRPSKPGVAFIPASAEVTVNGADADGIDFTALGLALDVPSSVTGGSSVQGSITISAPAPSGGVVVSLSDNSSFVSVPATVTITAGTASATFTISTTAVTSSITAMITAGYGSVTNTAAITDNPPPP
ncbi:MAG: hypothetical protein PHH91_10860, partial [Desulfuromonadaceae bacterium]|nr:hypothetical protein [Desulfuromonadaceae bacterium]